MKSKTLRSTAFWLGLWSAASGAHGQSAPPAAKPAAAQTAKSTAAQSTLSPQALVARAIAAEGGEKGVQDADTHYIMEGIMEIRKPFANTMRVRMIRKDDKIRTEVKNDLLSATIVMSKTGGWKEALGSVSDLSPEELGQQKLSDAHRQSLLLDAGKPGYTLTGLGKKKLPDGVSVDAVRITPPEGTPTDFYLHPDSGRILAIGYQGRNPLTGRSVRSLQRMIASKMQDGRMAAGEMRMYEDGELGQVFRMSRVDMKADIPDSLFERPGAAKVVTTSSVTLPFDFSTGELIVTASINGQARRFMVDTGAGITLILPQTAKSLGLKPTGKASLGGGGGAATAQFAKIDTLRLGDAELKSINAAVADIPGINTLVGGNLAGVLGYNVLSQFQVTLDYGKKEITLAPKDAPLPSGTPIQMDIFSNIALVDAESSGKKFRMMIDSGAMWTILPPRVAPTLKFANTPRDGAAAMGIDGSPVVLKTARLSDLTIGDQKVEGTLVSFAPPSEKSTGALISDFANGILGNTFLRRFRVTLDYAKQKAVLAPLAGGDPYPDEWTHPGVQLVKITADSGAVVAQVLPDSPAAKAGLKVMDAVSAIDDKPTATMTQAGLANALRGPVDSTVRLKVLRNGKPLVLTLKRVRLL